MEELLKAAPNGQWKLEKGAGTNASANPSTNFSTFVKGEGTNRDKEKIRLNKGGQWSIEPDKIKPGAENSREVPKEEK